MKQCLALAGLLCLLASGCASSGMMGCGDACGPGNGRRGVRPLITRDGNRPSCRGVAQECGPDGCLVGGAFGCGPCGACDGCAQGGPCGRLAERIAAGGCAGGLCPTGQYPESPQFVPGPPVGQAAYPYYTTRGPRDFLLDNPPHIGPY